GTDSRALSHPPASAMDPAWSPDGHPVAFVGAAISGEASPEVRYRARQLWIINADGSDAHAIAAAGNGIAEPRWSTDNSHLLCMRDEYLWLLDLRGGASIAVAGRLGAVDQSPPAQWDYTASDLYPEHLQASIAS